MRKKYLALIIGIFMLYTGHQCLAETVTLTSGKSIEGKVIAVTDDYVKIYTDDNILKVRFKFMSDASKQRMKDLPSPVADSAFTTPSPLPDPALAPAETKTTVKSSTPPSKPQPTPSRPQTTPPAKTTAPVPYHSGNARGKIQGRAFTVEKAVFNTPMNTLKLRQGDKFFADLELELFLFTPPTGETWENQEIHITPQSSGSAPHVHKKWKPQGSDGLPETETFTSGYFLDLTFQDIRNGKIKGTINLRLPDESESYVQGDFEAVIKKKSSSKSLSLKNKALPITLLTTLFGVSSGMFMLLGIASLIAIYFPFFLISQKTGIGNPFLAFIPIVNIFLLLALAKKPLWWILLLIVPFINIIIFFMIYGGIAQTTGKSPWQALLLLIPVINIFIPWYWALTCADKPSLRDEIL